MNLSQHDIDLLEKEMTWFAAVLDHQFKAYFNPEEEAAPISAIAPPDLSSGDSPYAELVITHALGYRERVAVMLALMPHIKPQMLDIFFTRNAHFDRGFTEFGGQAGKSHNGFLPTGETLNFILHKGSISGRLEVMEMFSHRHVFAQKDILRLERTDRHEPYLSGKLLMSEEFLSFVTTGQRHLPEVSELFPAKRITTCLEWKDLVLDDRVLEEIDQVRLWITNEQQLMRCKAFSKHVKPGFRTLFYGPPGTGKTLTACLIGKVTGRHVYRIDLSLVVSKYIGETEKNLGRIFDYAEKRNWILFFDEADSLFGKRTQTNSSNDRYANQEVSYLLQRIEDFPGVIILASNLKSNIDEAFSRRFQSIIYFPLPDKDQRLRLWNQFFEGEIKPEPGFDVCGLAGKYEISGGSAINVFRYGALKAIDRNPPYIREEDIVHGIRREYHKYGKTI